ncbi:hypothetical protein APHAL10511_007733 [Amanita phalloides]|nr:hypothetical protein APHAL10511_007733 [Amanita phalloides]
MAMQRNNLGISPSVPQAQVQQPPNPSPLIQSTPGTHISSPFPSQPPSFAFPQDHAQQQQQQQQQQQLLQPEGQPSVHNPTLQIIRPLDKARFDRTFKSFCNSKQIKIDLRILTVNNQPVDLHLLHTLVLREGGEVKVQQKDFWNVIGGRMGYVQFPGTDTESAKCRFVIAQQLEHIYKQYLSAFDGAFAACVLESRLKGGLARMAFDANQFTLMVSMADQQLRVQGFSESMIQFMEAHRVPLQRMLLDREGFHDGG